MVTVELGCEKRETRPKSKVGQLRRNGHIPAILYGPKSTPTAIAVSVAELRQRVSASGRLIRLKSSAAELNEKHVIVKDIQRTPVSGDVLHVDFYEVDLTHTLRVSVPLRFTGKAPGVVEGGILQPLAREVEVECLPIEIPEMVAVDVGTLGIHDVVHISALPMPGNIKAIFDTDYPVVTVLPPMVAEAPAAAAAVEGAVAEAGAEAGAAGATAPAAAGAEGGGQKKAGAEGGTGAKKEKA